MNETTTNCVIGSKPHGTARGYLCSSHFDRLAMMLRDVEDEALNLDARPSMQQLMDGGGGTLPSHRAPVRLDVLVHNDQRSRPAGERPPGPACVSCWHGSCTDIRAWLDAYDANAHKTLSILDVLHSWARVTREERDLTDPAEITVSGERDTLTRHLEWVAAQPWVDEMFADVKTLLGQLVALNGTGPDKPHCRCPVVIDGDACRGNVWIHDELQPVWRRYLDRCSRTWEYAPGAAVCDTCGSSWSTAADKARLKRMVEDAEAEGLRPRTEDGRPMLTAEELVTRGLAKSPISVRKAASRAGVSAMRGHYDPAIFGKATA